LVLMDAEDDIGCVGESDAAEKSEEVESDEES
jgi:hypothetical protein